MGVNKAFSLSLSIYLRELYNRKLDTPARSVPLSLSISIYMRSEKTHPPPPLPIRLLHSLYLSLYIRVSYSFRCNRTLRLLDISPYYILYDIVVFGCLFALYLSISISTRVRKLKETKLQSPHHLYTNPLYKLGVYSLTHFHIDRDRDR